MTESRDKRLRRKAAKAAAELQAATVTVEDSRWVRVPRPVLPPLKVGREWDRVRRIAYL